MFLSDVQDSSAARRTRSRQSRMNAQHILQHVPAGAELTLVMTERKWPTQHQVDAIVDALAQHTNISRVTVRMVDQLDTLDKKRTRGFGALMRTLCVGLATRALHIQTLQVHPSYYSSGVTHALSQAVHLRHLVYSGVYPVHLKASSLAAAVTQLASLTVDIRSRMSTTATELQQTLQTLSSLTRLCSLELIGSGCRMFPGQRTAPLVQLPEWPHLQHLQLGSTARSCTLWQCTSSTQPRASPA
jgi:hypothetical protein